MAITYRDIEVAPLPAKEVRTPRARKSKYPLDGIAVGGARAFPMDGKTAKSAYSALYVTAARHRKANPDFQFKVIVRESEGEVWVHRVAVDKPDTSTDYNQVAAE